MKLILIIHIFHLTQCIQDNFTSTCHQYKIINKESYIHLCTKSLEFNMYWVGQKVCLVLSATKRHIFHYHEELYWTTFSLNEWTFWPNHYFTFYQTSIWMSHISCAQQSHVATGYCISQWRSSRSTKQLCPVLIITALRGHSVPLLASQNHWSSSAPLSHSLNAPCSLAFHTPIYQCSLLLALGMAFTLLLFFPNS